MMNDEQIKNMALDIIGTVDYDLAKQYDEETAEEPELVEDNINELVKIAKEHMEDAGC